MQHTQRKSISGSVQEMSRSEWSNKGGMIVNELDKKRLNYMRRALAKYPVEDMVFLLNIIDSMQAEKSDDRPIVQQRIEALEKEVADLKRQLEERPFKPHDASDENSKQKCCY